MSIHIMTMMGEVDPSSATMPIMIWNNSAIPIDLRLALAVAQFQVVVKVK
jgi:hypothetical protein